MIAAIQTLGRRFLLMLGGEVVQSAFSFILNILLVRALSEADYGVFATIVLIGGFGVMYMRSLIGVPACTYIPRSRRAVVARAYAVSFGSGAMAASLASVVLVAGFVVLWRPADALEGGLFVGAWALRSYVRMALFAQARADLATGSDFAFAGVAAALCVPLILRVHSADLLPIVLVALAVAHMAGAAFGTLALRQPVRLSLRYSVRRRFMTLLPSMVWSIISVTAASLQAQGAMLALALVSGPAAYAPIAATMTFFVPLRLAASTLANMTQPAIGAKLADPDPRKIFDVLLYSTGLITLLCVAYGLAMTVAFPVAARYAFAGRFADVPLARIAVFMWAIASVAALYSIPKAVLEAAQRFRANAYLAAVAGCVGIPIVVILLAGEGAAWSLAGLLLSELVVLAGSWALVMRLLAANAMSLPQAPALGAAPFSTNPVSHSRADL